MTSEDNIREAIGYAQRDLHYALGGDGVATRFYLDQALVLLKLAYGVQDGLVNGPPNKVAALSLSFLLKERKHRDEQDTAEIAAIMSESELD